jgi:hypothetical protein
MEDRERLRLFNRAGGEQLRQQFHGNMISSGQRHPGREVRPDRTRSPHTGAAKTSRDRLRPKPLPRSKSRHPRARDSTRKLNLTNNRHPGIKARDKDRRSPNGVMGMDRNKVRNEVGDTNK